ncbi:Adaptive-response sensory-kinase SasA [Pseudomonas fluorescens]|uniref:histidine kinase n=1 Tax=Pseudomonas fluorescens TaxID=294 RepID=A0A5E7QWK6_PSEFL|nr:PAS domain-containing sensor histidine kinase [Pseudomonas fluorescens]VVP66269.1 Adaptive-response sensory-kinase SasA [Pseudomonas fluorescens]
MIEPKTSEPADKRSAPSFLPSFFRVTFSKMLFNSGQRPPRPSDASRQKSLENCLVWVMGLIVAAGIIVNTETRADLPTATLCIALLLMAINLFSITAVIVVALFCMLMLTALFLYHGGFERWETTADFLGHLTVLAAITLLALRSKSDCDGLRHKVVYFSGSQQLSQTGCLGFRGGREQFSWSEQSARIYEYPVDVKPTVSLLLARTHPGDVALVQAGFEKAARHEPLIEIRHRLLMPDGRIKHVHMTATPLSPPGCGRNRPVDYLGAVRDVTASKQAEEALCRAQTQLAHVTRVTSLGELAASIAHEVNQPLAAITSSGEACLNWLGQPAPDLAEARQALERIIASANRATEVTRRVRALSRKSDPLRQTESLNDIVSETLGLVRYELAHHKINPSIELATFVGRVSADRVQLQQVIINLIINACQAMETVQASERSLYVRTWMKDSEAVLEITDRGSGIPAEILPQLFTPFFTTKENGLGMGLSICRSIIDFHNGRIWATPASGQGSSFLFALPVLVANEPDYAAAI